jgi:hypothetical protein
VGRGLHERFAVKSGLWTVLPRAEND